MALTAVNDGSFADEVLAAAGPVLVDFWAGWCRPCSALEPILAELAEELRDRVRVLKLNIEENPESALACTVVGLPTLILFSGGQPLARRTGPAGKGQLQDWIESQLAQRG
jgi:thioredoxin 1